MNIDDFNSLYIKHAPYIISVLKARREYSEDVMSDTYLRLAEKVDRVNIQSGFIGYFIGAYKLEYATQFERAKAEMQCMYNLAYYNAVLTGTERARYNEDVGIAIDNVLSIFEQIRHNGTTEYKSKDRRRKCLQLYLQGYRFMDIAKMLGYCHHSKVSAMLWNIVRDIQRELKIPISPKSESGGVLATMGTTPTTERDWKSTKYN
jgi:DNA-directed RNA polymerase specialized sigma24 family protein